MRLFIVTGYNDKGEAPAVVYCGRSGSEMDAAIAAAPYQTIEKFLNPVGIRKNNPRAAANAEAAEAAFAAEVAAEQETYNAAVRMKADELAAALRETHAAELQKLRDEAASALAATDKAHREALAALEQKQADAAKSHEAELAKKDAEIKSLGAALKAAKKSGDKSASPAE